jgi:hypothetical protein
MNTLKLIITLLLVVIFSFSCEKNPAKYENNDGGKKILFIRNTTNFNEICTMKPDGSDIKVIARNQSGNSVENYQWARWSPDKKNLVIQGGPGSTLDYQPLWLMDFKGNLLLKLTWNGWNPLWKDDSEILFTRTRGYFSLIADVYSITVDAKNEDIIYQVDDSTGFSLSDIYEGGKYLLGSEAFFFRDSLGTINITDNEIVKFNIYTKEIDYLTNNNVHDTRATLSPDETIIAYTSMSFVEDSIGIHNIYLMTSEGKLIKQLTDEIIPNPYSFLNLVWSPDGMKLAYSKADQSEGYNPYSDIYIIDIKTKLVKKLTNTAKDKTTSYVMGWK